MYSTITLGGKPHNVAPLKALQVAEFLDAILAPNATETRVAIYTRTIRTIARSMKNAGDPLVASLDEEGAIQAINETMITYLELDPAFGVVLDISSLKRGTEGEAPAAESTSNESSAAS